MKVLVTGATGFVGRGLCRALADAGHGVVGVVRTLPDETHRESGVEYALGDVLNADSLLPDTFGGCDAVMHLVGIITPNPGKGQTFEAVHVRGTGNVLRAAGRADVKRFVYLSALGADPKSPSEYARTKATAERLVAESEIPSTIFRPSVILGPGSAFAAQIEQLIRRPPLAPFPLPFIPIPGDGKNQFQPVWLGDLTHCLVASLTQESAVGQTYEIGGAEQVTFDELVQGFADTLGVKKPFFHAPMPLMFGAASLLEAVLPKPPVTVDQLLQLRRDNVCDNTRVREAFGLEPMGFGEMLGRM